MILRLGKYNSNVDTTLTELAQLQGMPIADFANQADVSES